jgi:transcriptional regulator with XRE-family HTH domain
MTDTVDAFLRPGTVTCVDATDTLAERLRQAIAESGMKNAFEVERLAKLAKGSVSRMLSGERGKEPAHETIRKLAVVLGVRMEWLAGGEGSMRADSESDVPCLANRPGWSKALATAMRKHPSIPAKVFSDLGASVVHGAPPVIGWLFLGNLARDMCDAVALYEEEHGSSDDTPPAQSGAISGSSEKDDTG